MRRFVLVALLACLPALARAAPSLCPEHFAGGVAPDLLDPRLADRARLLCFRAFAVLHSGVTRTPLWSAEHLTAANLDAARATPREGEFHEERGVPADERADLDDYARSGWDRGHMAPSGDMPDEATQQECFTLANMVPQQPELNRSLWAGIESAVRTLAERDGELYVVTGPVFRGANLQALRGRVLVPTAVFKAVYDPRLRLASAYLAPNDDSRSWRAVSVAQLARITGIDLFPALPAAEKNRLVGLPDPTPPYGPRARRTGHRPRSVF